MLPKPRERTEKILHVKVPADLHRRLFERAESECVVPSKLIRRFVESWVERPEQSAETGA